MTYYMFIGAVLSLILIAGINYIFGNHHVEDEL